MRTRPILRTLAIASWCSLASCVTTTDPTDDRPLEEQFGPVKRDDGAQATAALLMDLDRLLNQYVTLEHRSGSPAEEVDLKKVERYLRQTVSENFDTLMLTADSEIRFQRAIALAALGFSSREEALQPLWNAVSDEDPTMVDNAVLGLAVLGDPKTPLQPLARIVQDESRSASSRGGAAWALYRIQGNAVPARQPAFAEIWTGILDGPIDSGPPMATFTALRGLGFTRNAEHRETIEPYLGHPVPRVRMAAAVALGRIKDPAAAPALIELLGPQEAAENVRLCARKALQALAGGADRGYDAVEWRRLFERGNG